MLSSSIKQQARELGFSMAGIVPTQPSPQLAAYLRWIEAGMHGSMGYLARGDRIIRRQDLNVILPEARSLIVVGMDYFTARLPEQIAADPLRGRISNYAWGVDYHDLILPRLETLAETIRSEVGGEAATRAYVDTGAILERSHAAQAGLGFTGKNTMLIHPRRGSLFFLGEIITDLELEYDQPPSMPGCGRCTRCLTACPTNAFPQPYVLDARLCISYLTIEHKGFIPRELRPLMGNWIYGCDVCQEVCPWQRFAQPAQEAMFAAVDVDRAAPRLADLLTLNEAGFAERFRGSPIYRIKRERLVRNACIAAGNSNHPELADSIIPLLEDESALVRGHAAWALSQLRMGKDALYKALKQEVDERVANEIRLALV